MASSLNGDAITGLLRSLEMLRKDEAPMRRPVKRPNKHELGN
jgi:hypothetical protein